MTKKCETKRKFKKERIKELRKLAHGAGICTHGMELEELEKGG